MSDPNTPNPAEPVAPAEPVVDPNAPTPAPAPSDPPAPTDPPVDPPPAPPEPVDYTFEVPEGVELDAPALDEFKALAKEAGLKPEQAQKGVDIAVKLMQAWETRAQEAMDTQVKDWEATIRSDKELGGTPEKLEATLAVVQTTVARFGNDELRDMLATTRVGSHPEIIRFLHKVGLAMAEDSFPSGSRSSNEGTALKDALFPSTKK